MTYHLKDPLTLTLNHPLKNRVEKLSARPTGTVGRIAALSLILSGTALAAPLTQTSLESVAPKQTVTGVFVRLSERRTATLQSLLDAVRDGTGTQKAVEDFMTANPPIMEVISTSDGTIERVQNRRGQSIPVTDLSDLEGLVRRCDAEAEGKNTFYLTNVPIGEVRVECNTTTARQRDMTLEATEKRIAALMGSETIPLKSRKASARGMMAGHLNHKFKQEFPEPTPQQEYDECLYRIDLLNRHYGFEGQIYDQGAAIRTCEKYKPTAQ